MVPERARRHRDHGAIEAHLQALRATVAGLADQLSAQSGSTSTSPSPSATPSPATSAPSPSATALAAGFGGHRRGHPTPRALPQTQPLGDGVDAIIFPDSSATAELLVGVPAGSTEPVLTRAARLAALSKFATVSLVKAAAKVGDLRRRGVGDGPDGPGRLGEPGRGVAAPAGDRPGGRIRRASP